MTSKFLNCREWRSFLTALQGVPGPQLSSQPGTWSALESGWQSAAAAPSIAAALKAGHDWLCGEARGAEHWLLVNGSLGGSAHKTFGV